MGAYRCALFYQAFPHLVLPYLRVYYYFYERSKGVILGSRIGGKGLSTLESIITGLVAGEITMLWISSSCFAHATSSLGFATTIISNPIWVVQPTQAVRTLEQSTAVQQLSSTPSTSEPRPTIKKLGIFETIAQILEKDGLAAFWRGIGPALVLVINPVIQYTVFEQLKNMLVRRRLAKLRAGGPGVATAVAILTDWDYFFLGALSKLGG